MIKEEIRDDLRMCEDGKTRGRVVYTYTSPTHWSRDGICQVTVHHGWRDRPEVSMNWGSGGVSRDVTDYEIAIAMSEAFKMASTRLASLQNESHEA